MTDLHKNFAASLVATAPSPAASGTSLVVTAAEGALFPTVPFNATIWPAAPVQPTAANAEIVRVTGIATDTFTIVRAQESSSARTVVVGDQIAAAITNKTLTDAEAGVEIDYAENTSPVTITATSAATATTIVTGAAVTYDGGTKIKVEFGTALVGVAASATLNVHLWDGSTDLGRIGGFVNNSILVINEAFNAARYFTPSNASHTFSIRAYRVTTDCTIFSGAGGADTRFPIYMRITRA